MGLPPSSGPRAGVRSLRTLALVALIGIVLLAAAVRLWHLDHEPMHVDEIKQAQEVQEPWSSLPALSYAHQQPPLDYFLGRLAVDIAGNSDAAQRFPSFLAGVLIVALSGLLVHREGYPIAGVMTAAVTAVNPFLITYSQYARPYALPVAMVLAVLFVHQSARLHGVTRVRFVVFVSVAALAMISRALMPVIALGVFFLTRLVIAFRKHPGSWRKALRSDVLALVALPITTVLVWVPSFIALRANSGHLAKGDYDLLGRLVTAVERFTVYGERVLQPWSLIATAVAVAAVLILPRSRRALKATASVWLPIALTPPLFTLAHSVTTTEGLFFADRYLVFLPLGITMMLAIALDAGLQLSRPRNDRRRLVNILAGAVTLIVVGAVVLSAGSHAFEEAKIKRNADWKATGEYIASVEEPGDVILTVDTRPFAHAWRAGFLYARRYYDGATHAVTPNDVIAGDHAALVNSHRLHVVLFVPRLEPDMDPPPGWEIERVSGMVIATSPELTHVDERIQDLQALTMWLRSDVAVRTEIAVSLAALSAGRDRVAENLAAHALLAADAVGQRDYAERLLEQGRGQLP